MNPDDRMYIPIERLFNFPEYIFTTGNPLPGFWIEKCCDAYDGYIKSNRDIIDLTHQMKLLAGEWAV